MPELSTDKILDLYYEKIKDQYPELSKEEVVKICKSAFWFFNKSMSRPDMPIIHIKYLGEFVVLANQVKKLLRNNNSQLKWGHVTIEEHKIKEEFLLAKLKEVESHEQQVLKIVDETEDNTEEDNSIHTGASEV